MRARPLLRPRSLAAVAVAAVVALALVACGGDADALRPGEWTRIAPGGKTSCARGGEYAYWIRRGDPKRLLVFFQGGGGCFDERTCAPGSRWFDDRVTEGDAPRRDGGVLALDDPRNPFRGWSAVFVPSCTGDVHLGDVRARYGSTTIEHRGFENARAALARAYSEFPSPRIVFVAGCSAGSVGSAFHVDSVLRRYPAARVTQLGDSLAFLFHRPVSLADWGAHERFPSWFRVGERRWTMVAYLEALARRYPRRTFARFNHAGDDVQEIFYEAVGGRPERFPAQLRAAERRLKRLPNYRSYLACGDEHCALPTEEFYSRRVGGVALRDWVADLAHGRDVACPVCGG